MELGNKRQKRPLNVEDVVFHNVGPAVGHIEHKTVLGRGARENWQLIEYLAGINVTYNGKRNHVKNLKYDQMVKQLDSTQVSRVEWFPISGPIGGLQHVFRLATDTA